MAFLPRVFCCLDLGNLGGHDNWVVLSKLSLASFSEIEFTVMVFRKSVGLAESGLTLALVTHDTNLLGTFIAFVGFLFNWLRLLFNNLNRLGFSNELFLIDGDFMAY